MGANNQLSLTWGGEADPEHHVPEHLGELGMGEGQGPETEVGGGVGHGPQHELYGVDALQKKGINTSFFFINASFNTSLIHLFYGRIKIIVTNLSYREAKQKKNYYIQYSYKVLTQFFGTSLMCHLPSFFKSNL